MCCYQPTHTHDFDTESKTIANANTNHNCTRVRSIVTRNRAPFEWMSKVTLAETTRHTRNMTRSIRNRVIKRKTKGTTTCSSIVCVQLAEFVESLPKQTARSLVANETCVLANVLLSRFCATFCQMNDRSQSYRCCWVDVLRRTGWKWFEKCNCFAFTLNTMTNASLDVFVNRSYDILEQLSSCCAWRWIVDALVNEWPTVQRGDTPKQCILRTSTRSIANWYPKQCNGSLHLENKNHNYSSFWMLFEPLLPTLSFAHTHTHLDTRFASSWLIVSIDDTFFKWFVSLGTTFHRTGLLSWLHALFVLFLFSKREHSNASRNKKVVQFVKQDKSRNVIFKAGSTLSHPHLNSCSLHVHSSGSQVNLWRCHSNRAPNMSLRLARDANGRRVFCTCIEFKNCQKKTRKRSSWHRSNSITLSL